MNQNGVDVDKAKKEDSTLGEPGLTPAGAVVLGMGMITSLITIVVGLILVVIR